MKKIIFLLFMMVLLLCTALTVSADGYGFSTEVDINGLIDHLEVNAANGGLIDISEFKVLYNDRAALNKLCLDGAPLLFHVKDVMVVPDAEIKYIEKVYFVSVYDNNETYHEMYNACIEKSNELLEGIKGNDDLDDITKALILHDRLAEICRYDRESTIIGDIPKESSEMCGPFINGKAICTGYSSAYMYLLRQVGIESRLERSLNMNHAWLIVTIYGKEYHIDITFNDAIPDISGRISHEYFLISTEKLLKLGKNNKDHHRFYDDWDRSPSDTTYDEGFWETSETTFCLAGNDVYFIDHARGYEAIYRVDSMVMEDRCEFVTTRVLKLNEIWFAGDGYCWDTNHYCLDSDGINLFYSGPKNIYMYDISKNRSKIVYTPNIENMYDNIFGFKYDNGYLVYSVAYDSDFNPGVGVEIFSDITFQNKVLYDPDYDNNQGGNGDNQGGNGDNQGGNDNNQGGEPEQPDVKMTFKDVKEAHWFYSAVKFVVSTGYMNGMSSEEFSPGGNITREQFVLILANMAEVNTDEYMYVNSGFADVKTGKWFSGAVAWAVREGYVSGMSATKFGTGQPIQRGALARLLYVYGERNGVDVSGRADLSVFSDFRMLDQAGNLWMKEPVQWAVDKGIISGMPMGEGLSVNPKGTATRAQTAVMLQKFETYLKDDLK